MWAWWCLLVLLAFGAGWLTGRRRAANRPSAPASAVEAVAPGLVSDRQPPLTPFADVVDRLTTGVVLSGANGMIVYRNRAAAALRGTHGGLLVDAAIERHLDEARHGRVSDETVALYGPPRRVFVVRAEPTASGGAVAFVDDISERRRIDSVRTDFVTNVSHELKTPVGALSVLAEALADEQDPSVVRRLADRMLGEAQRASQTIDDLIELSRVEIEGAEVRELVSVDELLSAARDRVAHLADDSKVKVEVVAMAEGGVRVLGDRRQLSSALGNLVENAVKYSDAGSTVMLSARCSGDFVELSVSDTGVGIAARDLDRVFERFYRADRARSRATGGTGLGLAIVRHVATNHGGDVRVASVEGEGSTFTLQLPIAEATP